MQKMERLAKSAQLDPSKIEGFQPEAACLGGKSITVCYFVFHN